MTILSGPLKWSQIQVKKRQSQEIETQSGPCGLKHDHTCRKCWNNLFILLPFHFNTSYMEPCYMRTYSYWGTLHIECIPPPLPTLSLLIPSHLVFFVTYVSHLLSCHISMHIYICVCLYLWMYVSTYNKKEGPLSWLSRQRCLPPSPTTCVESLNPQSKRRCSTLINCSLTSTCMMWNNAHPP